MKLTGVIELGRGGIADYAHDQAIALAERDIDFELLCVPSFMEGRSFSYPVLPILNELRTPHPSRLVRGVKMVKGHLANMKIIARHAAARRSDAVLLHFSEYMAPLWAWRLRRLRRRGVTMLTVLHDPVRDYVVGPRWWHSLSIRQAYSFLDAALVHTRDPVPVPEDVRVVWVPYGIHPYPAAQREREAVRAELDIPAQARLITSFGYVRDNKNLDLVLRAIADMPDLYLLVAGSEQAGGNRPMSFYRDLAATLGCADRCRWLNRFVSTAEAADLMNASDLSLLVYARSFVSSSAALGVTANYRLPSLVSNGSATVEALVKQYQLGIWVEPDSIEAIRQGLRAWLEGGLTPDWAGYGRDHSWTRNAAIVEETINAAKAAIGGNGGIADQDSPSP